MNDTAHPIAALIDPSLAPIFWSAKRLDVASTWWPHVPFGHWIVAVAQPAVVVELGTGTGVSYCAFCQAVAREALDTRCYAIDPWDNVSAAGVHGQSVLDNLTRFHDRRYGAFSTLVRSNFDEALGRFADGSVDLLHIEGSRTSESVRQDFEAWKSKLSGRAIVLIHTINSGVGDAGVRGMWRELRQCFPNFEFPIGDGLGVLAVGDNVHAAILTLCSLSGSPSASVLRSRLAEIGRLWRNEARETKLAQDLDQRVAAALASGHQAQQEARAWETRAKEEMRARQQMSLRIDTARRDVYIANLLAEQASRERDAILASTFWRVTRPLRMVAKYIREPIDFRRLLRLR